MGREQIIKSDLDEGQGIEGKRPRDVKASIGEDSGSPLSPGIPLSSDEKNRNSTPVKSKPFNRLAIKDEDEANIFRDGA